MTRWFRYYDDALDDPKVQRLSGDLFKTWANLLALTSKNDGKLPSIDDIAFRLRISVQDAQSRVEELILAGLIDIAPDQSLAPHNWSERQYVSDSSASRMQKLRKKKRSETSGDVTSDVTSDVTVTAQIRSDSETDKNTTGLSCSTAARKRAKEDPKGLKNIFGMKDDKKERLHARAEGLGLNVEELVAACHAHKAKNIPAYFTSLCVQQLQSRLKDLGEPAIRAALWDADCGPDSAYQRINRLLVGAA